MSKHSLTQRRVDNAKPQKKQYQISDRTVKGLCLRVYPQCSKSAEAAIRKNWILRITHQSERHFINIGDASALSVDDARNMAREHIARIKATPNSEMLFDHVAAEVFARYGMRMWKKNTRAICRKYYRLYIEPVFTGKSIDSIMFSDVQKWHSGLSATPEAANRSLTILNVIFCQSEEYGYRKPGSNPCQGIRMFRSNKRERHLTDDEIKRLGSILRKYESKYPDAVAAIRLLILTGCRKTEILSLEWRWYRDGCLHLPDSKTGPRIIFLCKAAKEILDGLRKKADRRKKHVFSAKQEKTKSPFPVNINYYWYPIRKEAGLDDFRLIDLRHTYASHALRNGVNFRIISHLLGHARPDTTMKYLHFADSDIVTAVNRINKTMLNPKGE